MNHPDALTNCLAQLSEFFGPRLSTAKAIREQHGTDVSFHPPAPPDAVIFAQSTEEVAFALARCHEHRVPVVPFGTGTSCEGHIAALEGGICIDMSQMNAVLRVSAEDMDCTVQAGVTRKQLNSVLHGTGLFFPIDPGADASLGGMCSTRASGTNAVRYGTMKENVLGLTVVLADGEIIRTGTRARKSAAGYDLTRVFVGAEGTLGIITEVTLKLHPLPESVIAAVCAYPTLSDAVDTVIEMIQQGVQIARVELLDELQVRACNQYSKLSMPELPTLFFEFGGSPEAVAAQVELVRTLSEEHGGSTFEWASKPEDRSRLWAARHDVWWAALALRPGGAGIPTDACVPISALTQVIEAARHDVAELGLVAPISGHVGDGNFHLCIVVDPGDPEEMARAEELNRRLVQHALSWGGTCTGEHGIGYGKIDALQAEHGAAVRAMAAIKRALDPRNIMNPGKIFPVADHPPYA